MNKVWRWVLIVCACLFVLGAALAGVAYATGGSFERIMATTDVMDMTKFISREQLAVYLSYILP